MEWREKKKDSYHLLAPTNTFTLRGGTDVNIAARRPHPKITFTKMFSILVTPPIMEPSSFFSIGGLWLTRVRLTQREILLMSYYFHFSNFVKIISCFGSSTLTCCPWEGAGGSPGKVIVRWGKRQSWDEEDRQSWDEEKGNDKMQKMTMIRCL